MSNVYAVIMAGGRGERFWPLSTGSIPKPFIPLLGSRTLIQQTVDRLSPLVPAGRILISIGSAQRDIAVKQLPQIPVENFIVEPVGRDTAPCLAYCALHIERREADGAMLAVPADHYIEDAVAYRRTLELGISALPGATGVVFGIRPSRPETGYGYIEIEGTGPATGAAPVIRFVEKPDPLQAREYLQAGRFYWNSGIFLWRNRVFLDQLRQHMPDLYRGIESIRPLLGKAGTSAEVQRVFAGLPRISIDFGVMEKTTGTRMVPAGFAWDDIGTWAALERALAHDSDHNVAIGPHQALEAGRCVLYSDQGTIAAFGVSDLIIVQAHGNVLVCPKSLAPELKRLVARISTQA